MKYLKFDFKSKESIVFFFILIIAFLIRFYHLGFRDLWYDEAITLYKLPSFSFLKAWDPPFYYALLAVWVKVFGFSETSLRFPSLLFSLASVPVTFLLGKEIFNKQVGLYASLIIALSPFQIWYAQEARAYSMLLFFGISSAYFQYLFINRKHNKYLIYYTILAIFGVYIHPYYIFFVIAQLVCHLIYCERKYFKKILFIYLLIFFSFVPLFHKYALRLSYVIEGFWIPLPTAKSIFLSINNFFLGYNGDNYAYLASGVLVLVLFISAICFVLQDKSLSRGFTFCLLLFILPMSAAFLFSRSLVPIYLDRGLIICTPYYYLILGVGIYGFRRKTVKIFFIISILLLFIMGIDNLIKDRMPTEISHHIGVHLKKPIKPAVEFININSGPYDLVAFTNNSVMFPFIWYSLNNDINCYYSYIENEYLFPGRYRFLSAPGYLGPSYKQPIKENKLNMAINRANELQFRNLWVLSCDWPRNTNLDKDSEGVIKWLDDNFVLKNKFEFDGLWVYQYAKQRTD